ncbi:flavin reductase family protein [Oceanobacillus jeddahense]|uniref:flavin reductase family protein n=1 Tax=Oceanobacillus jeddahense TaxID=1462527 RepID=UPI000A4E3C70|nr:flavin reductase family protein [Oceanobacillus jeddahense]
MLIDPARLSEKELYKLLIGSVVPRPIAWVSTKSKEGIFNLSPFSFFNVAPTKPSIFSISISPGTREREGNVKGTLKNIRDTKEFVINIVNASLAEAMKISAENLPPEMDEFQKKRCNTSRKYKCGFATGKRITNQYGM